jgi:hypothetical protein
MSVGTSRKEKDRAFMIGKSKNEIVTGPKCTRINNRDGDVRGVGCLQKTGEKFCESIFKS